VPNFRIGVDDPTVKPDIGSGPWGVEQPSAVVRAKYQALRTALGTSDGPTSCSTDRFASSSATLKRAENSPDGLAAALAWMCPLSAAGTLASRASIRFATGDDAVRHMDHYLFNTGGDLTVDLQGMLREVWSANQTYTLELHAAQTFVEGLAPGVHDFTAGSARSGYNRRIESPNWYFAVGGYAAWGKGRATVGGVVNGARSYELHFRYSIFDRYNWDSGKKVIIPYAKIVIEDRWLGEFHRCGLAREFNMRGSVEERVLWRHGERRPMRAAASEAPRGVQTSTTQHG
jgi:hypothetical protein